MLSLENCMQYACPVANCGARASLESDDDGKRLNQWISELHDTGGIVLSHLKRMGKTLFNCKTQNINCNCLNMNILRECSVQDMVQITLDDC